MDFITLRLKADTLDTLATPQSNMRSVSAGALGVFAVGCALLVYNLYVNRFFYHDDALISLRYALNFVQSGDLSWNVGDRVEGYTNFLHLVSVSGLIKLGFDPILASRIVNALGALLLVLAIWTGVRRIAPGAGLDLVRAVAVAGALSSLSVAVWILGGLETVVAAAFLAWGVALLLPAFDPAKADRLGFAALSGLFFALAYLTRPDAVVMNFAAGIGVVIFGCAVFWRRVAQCVIVGAVPLAVIGLHMVWRLDYYGDPLPNTFYAKVGVDLATRLDGIVKYMAKAGLFALPVATLAVSLALLVLVRAGSRARYGRIAGFLAGCIVLHGLYIIWSGGDHMPAARVLTGILGPACLLLAVGLAALPRTFRSGAVLGCLAIFAAAAFVQKPLGMNPAAYNGTIIGKYIDTAWPDDAVVALSTAGSTPYHAFDKSYIDMLGLNDREIGQREDTPIRTDRQRLSGHSKGDGAAILRRAPDFVILGPAEGRSAEDPWFLSDLELAESPAFADCYREESVVLDRDETWPAGPSVTPEPLTFTFYRRTCAK